MGMTYHIVYLDAVVSKDIPRLDTSTKTLIKTSIEEKLTRNPVEFGKPLQYSLKGCRRLRIGDWRVIFIIEGDTVTIVKIGHRREIYE
jgi:addiction module RelE/StbE family toxin